MKHLALAKLISIALAAHCHLAAAQDALFEEGEYDATEMRATIERYSTRIETKVGTHEIPASVSYRLFVEALLDDSELQLAPESDVHILSQLLTATTEELARAHREDLTRFCSRINAGEVTRGDAPELARTFDELRIHREREVASLFEAMLDRLTPSTRQLLEAEWQDFSANEVVVFTAFDMSGIAQEMPGVAFRMLAEGCTRFDDAVAH